MITYLAVRGYRLFKDFETELQPGINVLIGANASGKSSLIELLRIIQSCCNGPIPPGIEPRPHLGEVLHPDAGGSMAWFLFLAPRDTATRGSLPRPRGRRLFSDSRACRPASQAQGYRYYVEVKDAERPVISDEVLAKLPSEEHLLGSRGGLGGLDELDRAKEWPLKPNEPMLSKATDPRAADSLVFRNDLLNWRFYTEFEVTRTAPLRERQVMGGPTTLDESGENLSSVLLSLFTNLEYEEHREELLSFLRTAVPEFEKLTPTPDPSGKYVLLQWREKDVSTTLSATDLSDGVLRLLLLGVICCNPHPPSLICIDEPEIGLHPKVLPLVGALLRRAAQRTQVIVLTHSPDLLYGMPIESVAVLRKEDGEAKIVWPKDNDLLRELVSEEVAGEWQVDPERLRDAFISGELDVLG